MAVRGTNDQPKDPPATATDLGSKLADTRKTNAEAEKIEIENASARLKDVLGSMGSPPYTGEVKLADNAALAEANMLGMIETRRLAEELAKSAALGLAKRKTVIVTANAAGISLNAAGAAEELLAAMEAAAARALSVSDAVGASATGGGAPGGRLVATGALALGSALAGISPLAAVGTLLSGVHSALGYFRSNYQVSNLAIAASERALLRGVAGALKASHGVHVFVDGIYGRPSGDDRTMVADRLLTLSERFAKIDIRAGIHAAAIAAIKQRAVDAGKTPPVCATAEDAAALAVHEDALGICKAASELHDATLGALKADAGGLPLLERSLREKSLAAALGAEAAVLVLNMEGAWATVVSKEGLMPARGVPVRVSSTVAASWSLFDLATGQFLGGDIEGNKAELTPLEAVKKSITVS